MQRLSTWMLCGYWVALVTATHLPKLPKATQHVNDKYAHLAAFALLAILLAFWFSVRGGLTIRLYAGIALGLAVYASLDELTQGLIPSRYCDVADGVADMIGVGIGLSLFAVGLALFEKRRAAVLARQ